jgi:DNA-binding GntR family transcriptional regulator
MSKETQSKSRTAQGGTLKTQLVRSLRDAIVSGKYKPGDRLNESQISREYRTSRIPVREALMQLQEQGLVMNHPHRGMFVNMLTEEDSQKISSLRILLEAEAIKLCRMRLTAQCERKLSGLVERMEAWETGPEAEAIALDLEFHSTIWKNAGNSYLEKVLHDLVTAQFAHQTLEHARQQDVRWPLAHHRQLLDVITGASDVTPETAMIVHLRLRFVNPERFSSLIRLPL